MHHMTVDIDALLTSAHIKLLFLHICCLNDKNATFNILFANHAI